MMKYLASLVLVMSLVVLAQEGALPELPFENVLTIDGLKMPPGVYLGEVAGIAVNSKGHVFLYTRTGSPSGSLHGMRGAQLFEFDSSGKFIREIGQNLYSMGWAHAVRVDKSDNIWIVDNGTNMVTKFDPQGRVIFALGRRTESVQEPLPKNSPPLKWRFNEPTDVAWDSQGNIYVSDGYVNSRVAKFDKDGHWVKAWGEKGSGPGQFNLPHAIAVDNRDQVYVLDRANERIQVFDTEGTFLRQIKGFGQQVGMNMPEPIYPGPKWPSAMCITPGPNQVMYTADYTPGRIYKSTLEGKLLGHFGQQGMRVGQLGHPHNLTCPSENEVFTAENRGWRSQKFRVGVPKNGRAAR